MAVVLLVLLGAGLAGAESTALMNYQGRLISGTNLHNGSVNVTFSLYNSPTGGVLLYRETDTVSVVDGVYATVVGNNQSGGGAPTWAGALWQAATSAWLGVAINAGAEFSPREPVVAAPYAVELFNRSVLAVKQGESFVIVEATTNAIGNGNNLRAAYAVATNMTPYGLPRSASNRVAVLLPPGTYNLGFFQLQLTANGVDLVGLSSAADDQRIEGLAVAANFGVLRQMCNDIRLENLRVQSGRLAGNLSFDKSDPAAYFPDSGTSNTVLRNCAFFGSTNTWGMRINVEYAGTYERCVSGEQGFGGQDGEASGTFIQCGGGHNSFGGDGGEASGMFAECTAGTNSFGGQNGLASGTFMECTGGDDCFGGQGGEGSGTFIECRGGKKSFGGYGGMASGWFRDCFAGDDSFGGSNGDATGVFVRCSGTTNCFGGSFGTASGFFSDCFANWYSFGGNNGTATGLFINCRGDNYCFAPQGDACGIFENCIGGFACFGSDGTASGFFRNCRGGTQCFGAYGEASGTFIDCYSGDTGFGGRGYASGSFFNCVGGQSSFGSHGSSVASGSFINCVAGAFSFGFEGAPGEPSGVFVDCIGSSSSFGGHVGGASGSVSGQFVRCWLNASSWGGQMAGRMEECRWGADVTMLAGAALYGCTVSAAITNSGSGNVRVAGNRCRALVLGNLTNLISTAYNVIDSDVN